MGRNNLIDSTRSNNALFNKRFYDFCEQIKSMFSTNVKRCTNLCLSSCGACVSECYVNTPVTLCPWCNTFTVMSDGLCMLCRKTLGVAEIVKNMDNGNVVLTNACYFGASIKDLTNKDVPKGRLANIKEELLKDMSYYTLVFRDRMVDFFPKESVMPHIEHVGDNSSILGPRKDFVHIAGKNAVASEKDQYKGPLFMCKL